MANIVDTNCILCSKEFSYKKYPSQSYKSFCSRSCQMKYLKRKQGYGSEVITSNCMLCNKEFTYVRNFSREYKQHCSLKCSTTTSALNNRSYDDIHKRWIAKYGKVVADEMMEQSIKKRCEASKKSNEKNIGKQRTEEVRKKISEACKGIPNILKGKTFVEFYGEERANLLCKQHSDKLKEGYSTGRLTTPFSKAKSNNIIYDGVRLRSKLEYSVIKYMVDECGYEFGKNLLYEPKDIRPAWIDENGVSHTYVPDLYDTICKIVFEIKPKRLVVNEDIEMKLKREAVQNMGYAFLYLSEMNTKNKKYYYLYI